MNKQVRKVMFGAVIAASYAAMTFLFSSISFGIIQFRISEILTILPFFFPVAIPGLFLGCVLANLLSPYGLADMLIGSMATLFAAILTMKAGKSQKKETVACKALACLPPVIINAIFIGFLIAALAVSEREADTFFAVFITYFIQIGFGQAAVLYLLGLPLMIYLPKMGVIEKLMQIYSSTEINNENL